jgi:hypothetical protein
MNNELEKDVGRKRLWPNFRYYPSIYLEGLKKSKTNLQPEKPESQPRFKPAIS